jgi:hypothetical protein
MVGLHGEASAVDLSGILDPMEGRCTTIFAEAFATRNKSSDKITYSESTHSLGIWSQGSATSLVIPKAHAHTAQSE